MTESEWVVVPPKKPEPPPKSTYYTKLKSLYLSILIEFITEPPKPVPPPVTVEPDPASSWILQQTAPKPQPVVTPVHIPPSVMPTDIPMPETQHQASQQLSVFPTMTGAANLDITNIVSQRLNAMRKLQENPNDFEAQILLNSAQKDVRYS